MEKYEYSILQLCEKLHMAKNGSADPLTMEESIRLRAFLVTRILDWDKSHPRAVAYDSAVFGLIHATLGEWA